MLDIKTLLPELKKLVTALSEDLLARCLANAEINAGLREAYTQIEKGGRTAQAFEVWREDYLDQVAVAWVLGCVFVRFMEDNHLIDECWLAGEGDRRKLAEDTHELYFREHPHESDREYFEHVFHEVGKIPACRDLFAVGKTPLWAVGPSGDAAMKLLAFWREQVPETGDLRRSFEVEDCDTRFLGDLYQDLSERARKKYALLQTPVFVEEFILDRTLDPAIDEFGLDEVRMIDPTCGSGHFLLGAFARLFDLWIKREDNEVVAAQKALDGVWGVDINPFAVAIARFRLIVVALQACAMMRLKHAPAWNIHLATGDSLLFGSRWDRDGGKRAEQQFLGTEEESWAPEIYACEDKAAISEVLGQQYHAVVGNPPYIVVRDQALNNAYRNRYKSCHRQYSLVAPFTERFFDLACAANGTLAGHIAMLVGNSFMKREFGKKLVEEYLPTIDLTHVIDMTGAFIPGHTTSTVILIGSNRPPTTNTVRTVQGIKGEPGTPHTPSDGKVWRSIVTLLDQAGATNEFISIVDLPRDVLAHHPWSLSGGPASTILESLASSSERTLNELVKEIGRTTHTGEDSAFYLPPASCRTKHLDSFAVPLVTGDRVRNWQIHCDTLSLFPYDKATAEPIDVKDRGWQAHFWCFRALLKQRKDFGQLIEERGLRWLDHSMFFPRRYRSHLSIAFGFVTTHNHFVLDRGGKVFNRSAPVIKLPDTSTEDDHYALLGYLNSSLACFWMKQVMTCKGLGGQGGGIKPEHWSRQYEFAATMMLKCPIPTGIESLIPFAKAIDVMSVEARQFDPESVLRTTQSPSAQILSQARERYEQVYRRMVAIQEELDWKVYSLFGLCPDTSSFDCESELHPEDRPIEQRLRQRMASGEPSIFYEVHSYRGTGERRTNPDESQRSRVAERLRIIDNQSGIEYVETPDFKRRWQVEPWDKRQDDALRNWLLDRLESNLYWPVPKNAEFRHKSLAQLSDMASGDHEFLQVAGILRGREDFDVTALVSELIGAESVPFLPVMRYTFSGMRKRAVWEKTWELQRKEDAGDSVGRIDVPPKYASGDFQKPVFWRLRGKLDVPKERWISFLHCETESDPSLVVGWAGWDHLQQATALVAYYDARKREGWDAGRLTPLLAGIDQLLPWIHQWHSELDPEFGETAGQSFQTMLEHDAHELGLTLEDIRAWTPPKKAKIRRKKAKA